MDERVLDAIYNRLEGRQSTRPYLLVAAAVTTIASVTTGILGSRIIFSAGAVGALGLALVSGMVIGVLAWGVLHFTFVRRLDPDAASSHLLILMLLSVLALGGGAVAGLLLHSRDVERQAVGGGLTHAVEERSGDLAIKSLKLIPAST